MSRSTAEHKAKASSHINFALITISTSRYRDIQAERSIENPSGKLVVNLLEEAGYKVVYSDIVSDDGYLIKKSLKRAANMTNVDVVVMCGGTGVTKTDVTIETVTSLIEKDLPGFGEVFRKLSYESVGSAAIITRATAGLVDGKVIFCLPGSPQAVELAMKRLIIPEAAHIVKHAKE